jgi:hypothetical protein
VFCFVAFAEPAPIAPESEEIVSRYLAATEEQQASTRGVSMETSIEAKLPKLKKEGRFSAFRYVSKLGRITYDAITFSGDNTVKKEVIARYLTAENQSLEKGEDLSITPTNYEFKYKGLAERDGRSVHVLEVKPHKKVKKKVGLFKGELWIDPETYLAVREAGQLVKNPSIFLKKVEFVREYEIEDGVARLKHLNSRIQTRLVGSAEIDITYSGHKPIEPEEPTEVADTQIQ